MPDGLCDFLSSTTNNWQYYSAFSIWMWKLGGFAEQKKWECNAKHLSSWTVCSSLEQCWWSALKPGTINLGLSLLAGFIQELNWSFKLAGEHLFLTVPCSHGCSCALPCTWSDLCEVKECWPPDLVPVPGASFVFFHLLADRKQHFWSFLLAGWGLLLVHCSPQGCVLPFLPPDYWQKGTPSCFPLFYFVYSFSYVLCGSMSDLYSSVPCIFFTSQCSIMFVLPSSHGLQESFYGL